MGDLRARGFHFERPGERATRTVGETKTVRVALALVIAAAVLYVGLCLSLATAIPALP